MMLPAALLQHHRQDVLHAEKHPDDVDVEHAAEGVERGADDRGDVALDAGIVVEHVDPAAALERRADVGSAT